MEASGRSPAHHQPISQTVGSAHTSLCHGDTLLVPCQPHTPGGHRTPPSPGALGTMETRTRAAAKQALPPSSPAKQHGDGAPSPPWSAPSGYSSPESESESRQRNSSGGSSKRGAGGGGTRSLQARRAKGSKLAGHMEPSGIDVLHALLAANGDVGGDAQALESAGDKMWLLLARATKVVRVGKLAGASGKRADSRKPFPAADLTGQSALEGAESTARLAGTCQQQRPRGRTQHTRQGGQWQGWGNRTPQDT